MESAGGGNLIPEKREENQDMIMFVKKYEGQTLERSEKNSYVLEFMESNYSHRNGAHGKSFAWDFPALSARADSRTRRVKSSLRVPRYLPQTKVAVLISLVYTRKDRSSLLVTPMVETRGFCTPV